MWMQLLDHRQGTRYVYMSNSPYFCSAVVEDMQDGNSVEGVEQLEDDVGMMEEELKNFYENTKHALEDVGLKGLSFPAVEAVRDVVNGVIDKEREKIDEERQLLDNKEEVLNEEQQAFDKGEVFLDEQIDSSDDPVKAD